MELASLHTLQNQFAERSEHANHYVTFNITHNALSKNIPASWLSTGD